MASEKILKLDEENFEEAIKSGVILVDFYADWCGPCRMLAPVLEQVVIDLESIAKIGKLDIDKSHKIANIHRVTSVPTMILFKEGNEVNRLVGLLEAEGIIDFVKAAL